MFIKKSEIHQIQKLLLIFSYRQTCKSYISVLGIFKFSPLLHCNTLLSFHENPICIEPILFIDEVAMLFIRHPNVYNHAEAKRVRKLRNFFPHGAKLLEMK
uniref:Uncharacterized protein n=1 Tax=Micrurus surinamensis TaxID=129470 RepID=A0A2D4Q6H1_MICSU